MVYFDDSPSFLHPRVYRRGLFPLSIPGNFSFLPFQVAISHPCSLSALPSRKQHVSSFPSYVSFGISWKHSEMAPRSSPVPFARHLLFFISIPIAHLSGRITATCFPLTRDTPKRAVSVDRGLRSTKFSLTRVRNPSIRSRSTRLCEKASKRSKVGFVPQQSLTCRSISGGFAWFWLLLAAKVVRSILFGARQGQEIPERSVRVIFRLHTSSNSS